MEVYPGLLAHEQIHGSRIQKKEPPIQTPSEHIVTTSLADEIAFRLQRKILSGDYQPGSRLVQDELCQIFGVSRTPIREALRKLQAQHLVEVIPNRGAKVRLFDKKELVEVYTIRAELEGFGCELAASKLTPKIRSRLKEVQGKLAAGVSRFARQEVGPDDESRFNSMVTESNAEFHQTIHRAAGNNNLVRMVADLQQFFPKDYIWQAVRSNVHEFLELNVEEHERVLDCLGAGDASGARREMKRHVLHAGSRLVSYLEDKHPDEGPP